VPCAKEGAEVAIMDRDPESAKAAAKRIGGQGAGDRSADVYKSAKRATAVRDACVGRFGGVDIVVSN